jgi:hypothetical protein
VLQFIFLSTQRALQVWYDWSDAAILEKDSVNATSNTATTTTGVCTAQDQEWLSSVSNEDLAVAQDDVNDILDDYVSQSF